MFNLRYSSPYQGLNFRVLCYLLNCLNECSSKMFLSSWLLQLKEVKILVGMHWHNWKGVVRCSTWNIHSSPFHILNLLILCTCVLFHFSEWVWTLLICMFLSSWLLQLKRLQFRGWLACVDTNTPASQMERKLGGERQILRTSVSTLARGGSLWIETQSRTYFRSCIMSCHQFL